MRKGGGVASQQSGGKAARPPGNDRAQRGIPESRCTAYIGPRKLAEEALGFGVPAAARLGNEGNKVGLWEPASVLPV